MPSWRGKIGRTGEAVGGVEDQQRERGLGGDHREGGDAGEDEEGGHEESAGDGGVGEEGDQDGREHDGQRAGAVDLADLGFGEAALVEEDAEEGDDRAEDGVGEEVLGLGGGGGFEGAGGGRAGVSGTGGV